MHHASRRQLVAKAKCLQYLSQHLVQVNQNTLSLSLSLWLGLSPSPSPTGPRPPPIAVLAVYLPACESQPSAISMWESKRLRTKASKRMLSTNSEMM